MAFTLVLNQTIGLAFIIKKNGEVSTAQPMMKVYTGDVISVIHGENAYLITDKKEKITILDNAFLVGEEGIEVLNLPSNIIDIITAIEEKINPTLNEKLMKYMHNIQVIIDANSLKGSLTEIISLFYITLLRNKGLTRLQAKSLTQTRYSVFANFYTESTFNDPANVIKALDEIDSITDFVTMYTEENTKSQIELTIHGMNDDSFIDDDTINTIVDNSGTLSTSGQLTSNDIGENNNQFITDTLITLRGEVTIKEDGQWTYISTDPTRAIERLGENDTLIDMVTVSTKDGTTQQLMITIKGVNNTPVFSNITNHDGYETNDVISVAGIINIGDIDYGEYFMLAGTYLGDFGSVTLHRAGYWIYSSDPAQSSALNNLTDGEQRVDTITVGATDSTETDILITFTGTNDPSRVVGNITGTIVEADGTISTTGSLIHSDVDSACTTQTIQGRWGELTLNENGCWFYNTNNAQGTINRLGNGEQLTDTIIVRTDSGIPQSINITIDGTNDAAVFGSITSTIINKNNGQLSTSGRATVTDADYGEFYFQMGSFSGNYGEVTINKAGNWTYTTDPSHASMLRTLTTKSSIRDTITIFSHDGTSLEIVVTIVGTDDLPVVSGQFTTTMASTTNEIITVTGNIGISDIDDDYPLVFQDVLINSAYGVLKLVEGAWIYTLDKENAAKLNPGELATDTITLTATNGMQQSIVISITGTNGSPELHGFTTGTLTDGNDFSTSGTIYVVDPYSNATVTLPNITVHGTYGVLTLVNGTWVYSLNPEISSSLGEGDITTDTLTITASNGSNHDIVITITGTDQEPIIQGYTAESIVDYGILTVNGNVELTDRDASNNPTLPNTTLAGQYGSLTLVDGSWTYTLDPELAQYLNVGDATTDIISITASDGTMHDIVISITGTNDTAVLSNDTTGDISNISQIDETFSCS